MASIRGNSIPFRALLGFSWAAGPPSSALSPQLGRGKLLAICIIPNSAGMFNENITFLKKYLPLLHKFLTAGDVE